MIPREKHDSEAVRLARVRQLFAARPFQERRSETTILAYYAWLEKNHPELLSKEKWGDPYEHLKSDLRGLYMA